MVVTIVVEVGVVRVATWNVNCFNPKRAEDKLGLLQLEVTYARSGSSQPRMNRMDRIYASPSLGVVDVRTFYADSLTLGSDHALVVAELKRPELSP